MGSSGQPTFEVEGILGVVQREDLERLLNENAAKGKRLVDTIFQPGAPPPALGAAEQPSVLLLIWEIPQ